MATSAFRSTTKRSPIGADGSASSMSSAHRRSRSLSRFSHRISSTPAEGEFSDEVPAPRGKFVNTVRGSGFPEINLDDLAVDFFDSGESSGNQGRSVSRNSGSVTAAKSGVNGGSGVAQRRGRSVSRHGPRLSNGGRGKVIDSNDVSNGGGRLGSDRRRRSVSVVRYQISDSESDLEHPRRNSDAKTKSFCSGNNESRQAQKPNALNSRQGLRRSFSQRDMRHCDGYSSQSSILTDDEGKDAHSSKFGNERTIRAVYAQNKGQHPTEDNVNGDLYETMRTEIRHAVEEIRSEFEHVRGEEKPRASTNGVSSIMRNYSSKLEESEKRKEDLISEIVLERQRSKELSKIMKELLPNPKNDDEHDKPSQNGSGRRSTDRNRMSERLSEEAEKYIEDFISSIEDTDISSIDGDRSDTSSSIGGIMKARNTLSPATPLPLPVEMDGISFPWLKWETSTETTPTPTLCISNTEPPSTPKTMLFDSADMEGTNIGHDRVILSASIRGSCSHGIIDSRPSQIVQGSEIGAEAKSTQFDMDEYGNLQRDEDLIFERYRQQNRIESGTMLLCRSMHYF